MNSRKRNDSGLTLLELMVAMAISIVVMAAIYQVYQSQQKAYVNQQMVVEMQQNARSALSLMKREIRMAGYKPAASDGIDNNSPYNTAVKDDTDPLENGRSCGSEIAIVVARRDQIRFRMDILPDDPSKCSDGNDDPPVSGLIDDAAECYDGLADDKGEDITYALQPNAAGDGTDLVRISSWIDPVSGTPQTETSILAYDIEAIAFGYAYDFNPKDGLLDSNATGDIVWGYDPGITVPFPMLTRYADKNLPLPGVGVPVIEPTAPNCGPVIRAVKIWLLARTPQPIRGETDTQTYQVGDQVIHGSDNPGYRRTLQTATIYCRNLRF
jgi:prepilin-type N-terminal cleavage/methylation domain-containing protein